jgi:hypothetical protein
MATVIEAPKKYSPTKKETSVFLAGGITNCPDWQKKMINLLSDIPDIVIYNPRRKNFPMDDPNAAEVQITWEYNYLKSCDALLFWFSRGSLNPIVLYELGKHLNSSDKKGVIGIDPEYERKQDVEIQTKLSRPDIEIVYSLDDLAMGFLNSIK